MPTKPEVLAVEEAHRAAQARLGVAAAYLALKDWSGVSATATATTADQWLTRSLQTIRAIRRKSVRLARAYYQLARALETGHTMGLPEYTADKAAVTMRGLREQFLDLLLEVADIDVPHADVRSTTIPATTDSDERWLEDELRASLNQPVTAGERTLSLGDTDLDSYIQDLLSATDSTDDELNIGVDEYEWDDEIESLEELGRQYAADLMKAAKDRADKIARIQKDEERTAKQAFKEVQRAHDAAGSINAGLVDQAGIDAGRDVITRMTSVDNRVMMWARGTGPNPCAWCAMLASRGFAYTSRARASLGGRSKGLAGSQLDSYHPNCHCFPVVRWADIDSPTAPERTAHYMALWKDKMKGQRAEVRGTKDDTLNKWRRIIAAERRVEREAHRKAYHAETLAKAKARIPGG